MLQKKVPDVTTKKMLQKKVKNVTTKNTVETLTRDRSEVTYQFSDETYTIL